VRIFVTGCAGQVGAEVVATLTRRNEARRRNAKFDVIAASHDDLDVADRDEVLAAIVTTEPDIVIHVAAFTNVDACESQQDRAYGVNALGTRNVQEAARLVGAHVAYLSSDYVFDGTLPRPYLEWDAPNPLSVYGRSKLGGEIECSEASTIIRTSWVCGRFGSNMAKTVLKLAGASDGPLRFVDDQRGCPTIASDLASVVCDLAIARRPGIFHVTNQGATTWYGFAKAVVEAAGGDVARVSPISTAELSPPRPAPRPANSVLENAALRFSGMTLLPDWHDALASLVRELGQ
jgi:dTDP-4-dehydrorhamnose reductase